MKQTVVPAIAEKTLQWLLSEDGDAAIEYQVHRDLLDTDHSTLKKLQQRIATEGWGKRFMSCRRPDGHWGKGLYRPKWTSTHYTLLDLKNLGYPPGDEKIKESVELVLSAPKGNSGGINVAGTANHSDICVNGMILNYACWFLGDDPRLAPIVEYLLEKQMTDGGWNCEINKGAVHSSLHSTISVLEGLLEWAIQANSHNLNETANAIREGEDFLLRHKLFRSHRTDEIIDPKMLRLSYPARWKYDILRALDYFRRAGCAYDPRMKEALEVLLKKRMPDGRWPLQARHEGAVHFEMENVGEPSRWNTLRALRVLKHFKPETLS